ncbi:MAG: MMPL family transporter, partial [Tomitella sp.]|nr:MMPL family transporter [Tomitella sp.]
MASILFRVGRFCFRRKWWIIAAWLAALIAVASLVGAFSPKFAKDFSLPGTDAGIAMDQMQDYFPQVTDQQKHASTSVLIKAEDGLADHTAQVDSLVEDLKTLPEVDNAAEIVNPVSAAEANPEVAEKVLGDNGKVGLIQVDQDIDIMDLTTDDKDQLTEILGELGCDGLQVDATG